jgi:N-acylglucosamine-6-phosphate 2-epimerase
LKSQLLNKIQNQLIVSCQAREGWPMHGSEIMAAFAVAAEIGGASAIRANGVNDIKAIKNAVDLPILGINKKWIDNFDVYITPRLEDCLEILACGIEMIAIDATQRRRPNDELLNNIVMTIKNKYPNVLLIGDISTVAEAIHAEQLGFDGITTTLNGYTKESIMLNKNNEWLVRNLTKVINIPIIAEGNIETPIEAQNLLKCGAFSIVVGQAITRPERITKRFVDQIIK